MREVRLTFSRSHNTSALTLSGVAAQSCSEISGRSGLEPGVVCLVILQPYVLLPEAATRVDFLNPLNAYANTTCADRLMAIPAAA